jgi:hypothetical protein
VAAAATASAGTADYLATSKKNPAESESAGQSFAKSDLQKGSEVKKNLSHCLIRFHFKYQKVHS